MNLLFIGVNEIIILLIPVIIIVSIVLIIKSVFKKRKNTYNSGYKDRNTPIK